MVLLGARAPGDGVPLDTRILRIYFSSSTIRAQVQEVPHRGGSGHAERAFR